MKRQYLSYLIGAILLLAVGYYGFHDDDSAKAFVPKEKTPFPDITLSEIEPQKTTLSLSSLKGKVVLVNFFASWCPPCKAELPYFEKEYEKYHSKGFDIIAISMDQNEDALKSFLKKNKFSFIVAKGSESLADKFNITGLPTSYLIDKNGYIVKVVYGEYLTLGSDLQKLLK